MSWLLKLTWMLLVAMHVQSGIIPEESIKQETKTYAQQSYLPQSTIFQSNQNYNGGNQQYSNTNVYGNTVFQNPQNNVAASAAAFQQSLVNQQQPLARTQQVYARNPPSVQFDDSKSYQSQYNTNQNIATNPQQINDQPSYASTKQSLQVQTPVQNVQAPYGQNNYNGQTSTNSREASSSYQKKEVQHNDQQIKDSSQDVRKIYPYPALDLGDTKSKTSRKIPLVLITIHKNKNPFNVDTSKTNVKKQSSDPVTNEQGSHNINSNVPQSPEKIASKPVLSIETSVKHIQNNFQRDSGEVQNNGQIYSGNDQQQYNSQSQLAPSQISQVMINQRYNDQVTPYRYPILAGKKMESSEWKPVDKNGIRVPGNRKTISDYPQSSTNQQNHFDQTQQRNFNSRPSYASNSNSVQTPTQTVATNYNINPEGPQYKQNTQNQNTPRVESTQSKGDKADYQGTSANVRQADNFNDNSGYNRALAINNADSQNYFNSNNDQGFKRDQSQQNAEYRTSVSATPSQTNFRNDQFSGQRANNKNVGEVYQDQRQTNSYQTEENRSKFFYGVNDKRDQTSSIGNTVHSNVNSNFYQGAAQNSSNYLPASHGNVNRYSASQTSSHNNPAGRNTQLDFSNNAQTYFGQSTQPLQTGVNNAWDNTARGKNVDKLEQKAYALNSFNAQSQENNFGKFTISQTPVSVSAEENKNTGISQTTNYGSNQRSANHNNVKPYQQANEQFSGEERYQQNTYNTVSTNNQQNHPTQDNYFQSSVKTESQTSQNYPQTQNQNIRPDNQNYGYVSNQENRNNVFQNAERFGVSNNRQNSVSPNEYHSVNAGFSSQFSKEPVKSEATSFNLKQDDLSSRNSDKQSVTNNYGFSNNQAAVNYDNARDQVSVNGNRYANKDINTNYDNAQRQGSNNFQGNSYGRNLNLATNIQTDQQNVFDSSARNPTENNYGKIASSNHGSALNSYQNSNYGSSESQDSVVGAKPDEKTSIDQNINNKQYLSTATNYKQSNKNKYHDGDRFVEESKNEATSKEVNSQEEDPDSAPEALLLVLVSAKKSALGDHADEEKDEMEEGYESAPEELVDLLNDESNRKMIIRSVQEAADIAYREQEKIRDEYSEETLESDDGNERY